MKAFKATYNMKCKGFTYVVGETYTLTGELKICQAGFHFCPVLTDCFEYYDIDNKDLIMLEVEILGETIFEFNKAVTDKIKILRIVPGIEWTNVKFDSRDNLIWYKNSDSECWIEYDERNNVIHYKYLNGYEYWNEYDENNNLIHHKDLNGYEYWKSYDERNNLIYHKHLNDLEYWNEYDDRNNLIHYKNSIGREYWNEYDDRNNVIYYKDSSGYEFKVNENEAIK